MSLFAPTGPGPAPGSIDHRSALDSLQTVRSITLLWAVVGAVFGLIALLQLMFDLLAFQFPGGSVGDLVYTAAWVVIDLIVVMECNAWTAAFQEGRYTAVREPSLLWGILSLLFGVVPGLLILLLIFPNATRDDAPTLAASPPPYAAPSTPAATPPPPSAPSAAPPAAQEPRAGITEPSKGGA